MPIFEFKCLECNEYFEILVTKTQEDVAMACPQCKGENFERVLSSTNYSMGGGKGTGVKTETKKCSSGNCTTYEIPGHSR